MDTTSKESLAHINGHIPTSLRDEMRLLAEAEKRSFNFYLNLFLQKGWEQFKKENKK
jgi:hypothetical protein